VTKHYIFVSVPM